MFPMEHANHPVFLNDEHGGRRYRGRSHHANGLARHAPFPKKIARSKNRRNGFFADLINHNELHTAFPNRHSQTNRSNNRRQLTGSAWNSRPGL